MLNKNITDSIKYRKIASKHGKREHLFGEVLGIWLWSINIGHYHFTDSWWDFATLFWTVYYISHRLEKYYYSKCLYDDRTK